MLELNSCAGYSGTQSILYTETLGLILHHSLSCVPYSLNYSFKINV